MDINELETYRLSDAIKFNSNLNPRLWGEDEQLRPEVREHLLSIADDFRESLGVNDLNVKDITISGSNAAYTYTPHSDIDLHLVVDLDNVCNNEVYRELFDAKKYQYNNEHNYKIHGYDVELYVQDSKQPHHSSGIYSIVNNDWIKVPSRRKPTIDDISVKGKYVDLGNRIEAALASGDIELIKTLWQKLKTMRQAGLDKTGEFGPENLAFKLLRRAGIIEKLKTAITQAKDQELSLTERKKKKKRVRYGYGGHFYPGYSFNDNSADGGEGGGESVMENKDVKDILQPFIDSCVEYLGIENRPKIILKRDPEWTRRNGTFGRFDHDTHSVTLAVTGRHTLDILRTLAHELTHAKQDELAALPVDAGQTGSPYEDEANAMAGRIMRHWVDQHPEFFKDVPVEESVKSKLAAAGAAVCIAGTPGCATTTGDAIRGVQAAGTAAQTIKHMGRAGAEEEVMQRLKNELRRHRGQNVPEEVTDEDYDPNGKPPGPEFKPTMPAGTVKVDVSDVYDWYKLGQHISDLEGLGQHDFGSGPPSTIMAFGSEKEEHKYIDALKKTGLTTTDIDPVDVNQPKGMPRQKVDPTYNVDEDKQSIDEAQISKNIQPILVKKGYAFLGKGQDQDAYLAPDGTVLKIFGYGPGGKLSQGQQSFKDFADYCMAKPNNPFLPQFGGWEPFDFEGKRYLQINCERMFDLSKSGLILVGSRLGQLASLIQSNGADRGVNKFLRRHGDKETGKLMSLVGGRQQFLLLANTIEQLDKLADRKGYRLDLHGGNFMLGSDGEIVINDPFFTGNWRFDESINESLDQPYKILRWEKGDYGDVDAIARLDDGTFLSIMFNKGFSQDTKEEAWSVEFYRNNSQEKTGEGDQQRVFATVLSAVQTFVSDRVPGAKGKYKPNKVYFSASKEVKPDEDQRKAMTRARLYDSLVQRYARALGFRAFRADTGNKVMYELSRIKPIAEDIADESVLGFLTSPNTPGEKKSKISSAEMRKYFEKEKSKEPAKYNNDNKQKPQYVYTRSNEEKQEVVESTGYIPVNDQEARDPRYSMAITQDIKPGEVQRQAAKMGFKTDAAGVPPLLMAKLQNQLKEIKAK